MVVTLSIDKAGRLVIPKPVRERLGLAAGAEVELSELRDGLVLKVLSPHPSIEEVDGLLVHQGRPESDVDLRDATNEQREDRIRELARS